MPNSHTHCNTCQLTALCCKSIEFFLFFFLFFKQLVATNCEHSNRCLPGDGDQDEKVTGVWLMATTVGYTCATTPQNIVVATCLASELHMYHLMVERRWMDGSGPAKKVTDGSHCGWAN